MAREIATERDISPWDALLLAVRLAAGRVAWVDERLTEVQHATDVGGEDDGDEGRLAYWLAESRKERTLLARTSKSAIDGGVAERLVRQTELETAIVVRVLGRTLDALGLDQDQRLHAYEVVHSQLLAIEDGSDLVEGEPP